MIAACLKWVDLRPEVDALTGRVSTDPRTSGASDADRAALEWALRLADAWGTEVVALSAGPPACEALLREALACGATRARRVDLPPSSSSARVAVSLAQALPAQVDAVVCGDWSLDRGSGSVPAFLAARLGAAQCLGAVTLDPVGGTPGELAAERRLDGGRRERLRLAPPWVVSVEGASARLRRASLDGVLRARDLPVEVLPAAAAADPPGAVIVRSGPFRPRPRVLPPPPGSDARERILALTGVTERSRAVQRLELDADAAAEALLAQLREWGYL